MATATPAHHDHAHAHDDHAHANPTGWRRYVYSTNHKDIGTMYLWFAIFAGVVGGILSIAMGLVANAPIGEAVPVGRLIGYNQIGPRLLEIEAYA